MASQPILPYSPHVDDELAGELPLLADEGWELLFSLFGSAKELYAKYGGGEAALRKERAAWNEAVSD